MGSGASADRQAIFSGAAVRSDVAAGLVSSTVAIPLAIAFGMFAFVTLGDGYFAYGAMAGLVSAAALLASAGALLASAAGLAGSAAGLLSSATALSGSAAGLLSSATALSG